MHVGETHLTTKPGVFISGENGQFRVVSSLGHVEWYFCSEHQIQLVVRDRVDKIAFVPSGLYQVEMLSATWTDMRSRGKEISSYGSPRGESRAMNIGEKQITKNPVNFISRYEGEFRVTDEFGRSELYLCAYHRILSIRDNGAHKNGVIPSGHFLVEKISDSTVHRQSGSLASEKAV